MWEYEPLLLHILVHPDNFKASNIRRDSLIGGQERLVLFYGVSRFKLVANLQKISIFEKQCFLL